MPQARSGPAAGGRRIDTTALLVMAAYGLANVILWNATVPDGRFLFANTQGTTSGFVANSADPNNRRNFGRSFAIWGPWANGAFGRVRKPRHRRWRERSYPHR